MRKLSKERLLKLHRITEPSGEGDPVVLARRKYQEGTIRWMDKALTPLLSTFTLLGLTLVLLPVLVKSWRITIEGIPIIRSIFDEYSTLGAWALTHFYVIVLLYFVRSFQLKSLPGGVRSSILTLRNIVDMELFPRTRKEELAFWSDFALNP